VIEGVDRFSQVGEFLPGRPEEIESFLDPADLERDSTGA
jgi:hypothetical protein